jgi:16S rRNA (cytidine1402-2'-O)-methyltransferase
MVGTLYVVATPIGNLEDLTFRALRILGEVDLIAAEDTRRTSKLLAHYEISKPLTSYREHNEASQTERLIGRLQDGQSIALVSDAGTPGISDPGARLVGAAHQAGVTVVPIPGASAVTAALSVSGMVGDQFLFLGFPPSTGKARRTWFEDLAREARSLVLFESPHRVAKTLKELRTELPNRPINIFRELTKIHETLVICPPKRPAEVETVKGEFVITIGPDDEEAYKPPDPLEIVRIFDALESAPGGSVDEALALTAAATGTDQRRVRSIIKKNKIWVKQQKSKSP